MNKIMAVAMAASACITTPIPHPANILVMEPGGYRFVDYLKAGELVTLVILFQKLFVLLELELLYIKNLCWQVFSID